MALVIGNGAYRNADRLTNPANDARLIASTLTQLGFEIVGGGPQLNLDRAGMTAAIKAFGRATVDAHVALFYYSGHGLQVEGRNWLVPVDANASRPQDLDFEMVDADLVLRQMDNANTKLKVMLLDACRTNPFGIRGVRGAGNGLAAMQAPQGTLISYATQPGNVALDGLGANSPYTTALSASMLQSGIDILHLFNQVGLMVQQATGGLQQPWLSSSPIEGDFSFNHGAGQSQQASLPRPAPNLVSPPAPIRPVPTLSLQLNERAVAFVQEYFGTWSRDNATASDFVVRSYASDVLFYGKQVQRDRIIAMKQDYLARWPIRSYEMRAGSTGIACDETAATCTIAGIVDWQCSSPTRNARSSGSATFKLRVDLTARRINLEEGEVMSRQPK